MRSVDESVCRDLARAARREWLETNGIGGYASSTIAGLNTRRYHGLLTAAIQPPVGRMVLLSKLEQTLLLGDRRYELSANQYEGAFHPEGYRYLRSFRLDPFPVLTYSVEDIQIEETIFMVHGENTVVVRHQLLGDLRGRSCALEIRPLAGADGVDGRLRNALLERVRLVHRPGVLRGRVAHHQQNDQLDQPTIRAGTPATVAPGGTSCRTTLPAATLASRPISTLPSTFAPAPSSTPLCTFGCRSPRSLLSRLNFSR